MNRPHGMMSEDVFKKILDEAAHNGTFGIRICGYGEPFMNGSIYEMIKYAKDRNITVHVTTNGSYLRDEVSRKRLLDSGCNKIKFSLQGGGWIWLQKNEK